MKEAHRAHDDLTNFYGSVNESIIKSGDAVLRASLLINGGAAVAILAFMGTVISKDAMTSHKVIVEVAPGLNWFASGVLAAALRRRSSGARLRRNDGESSRRRAVAKWPKGAPTGYGLKSFAKSKRKDGVMNDAVLGLPPAAALS